MRSSSIILGALSIFAIGIGGCDATVNNCPIDASPNLRNAGITTELRRPYRCEYTIFAPLSFVEYESMFYAPDTSFGGRTAWTNVMNMNGQQVSPVGYSTVFQRGFGCGFSPACAFTQLSFQAGTTPIDHPAPYGTKFRELAYITVELPPNNSLGNATLTLNGTIGHLAGTIGPQAIVAPNPGTWSADMTADTLSFQYRWYVNGSQIDGAINRTLSGMPYGESGIYTLTTIAELMDQTTDTVTKSIEVRMGAEISGPSYTNAGESNTWYAYGFAARAPLSCEWHLDYTTQPGNACTFGQIFSDPSTQHTITVTVTDARGVVATSTQWSVYVGCGGQFYCDE